MFPRCAMILQADSHDVSLVKNITDNGNRSQPNSLEEVFNIKEIIHLKSQTFSSVTKPTSTDL